MGSNAKAVLLIAVGFVIGVAATLLFRRESAPSKDSHRVVWGPVTTTTGTIIPPELAETPNAPSREKAEALPPANSSKEVEPARAVKPLDEESLRLGRPQKPDFNEILKAPTWEDFYKRLQDHKIWGEDYETAVFRKMVQVLGLNAERTEALNKLFKAEQLATANAICESCGGLSGLNKKMEELQHDGTKAALKEWRRIREDVRLTHNNEYLKVLSYQELALFNEHLRNEEIEPVAYHSNLGTNYHIGGVGKKPAK